MQKPLLILGGGGHAGVLIDTLKKKDHPILGVLDPSSSRSTILGVPILGGDEVMKQYQPDHVDLVNGLGSVEKVFQREQLFNKFKQHGYRFASVIHPQAILGTSCVLGEGSQVLAGAVLQCGVELKNNVIVNTGAIVDHDCKIGEHCHIAPGATLSGSVVVGEKTHIGTGAVVIQGVQIGRECVIGAGSVVIRSLCDGIKVYGNPATPR